MSTADESGAGGYSHKYHIRRKMSRRRLAMRKQKKSQPFQPDFHGLEKRMMPTTFMVMNTSDSGAGSLRQAILNSNATPGSNTITFDIGPSGSQQTISPLTALPSITVPVFIDGGSQPGYTGTPLIELDGASAGSGVSGLVLATGSSSSQVSGLVVSGFASDGISISSNDNAVFGCYVGTNAAGTAALANGFDGIDIVGPSSGNSIGAATAAPGTGPGNVISGNAVNGVEITGAGATGNFIWGNLIGLGAAGTQAIPNGTGVAIDNGASGNTIGGTADLANIISGNAADGIDLDDAGTSRNMVVGNEFGTSAAGNTSVGNSNSGVAVYAAATNNTISGNVVAGNLYGVAIDGVGTSGNLAIENLIGVVVVSGTTTKLPNGFGLLLQAGSTNNTVGGSSLAVANVISGNTNSGIDVGNTGTSGNLVENNYIGTDSASDTGLGNVNGVLFFGDSNGGPTTNTIGPGNVISGNSSVGVAIYNPGTSDNLVAGNLIGTNRQGTAALPNANGVIISDSATGNTIGGSTSSRPMSSRATRTTASRSPKPVPRATSWPATRSAPMPRARPPSPIVRPLSSSQWRRRKYDRWHLDRRSQPDFGQSARRRCVRRHRHHRQRRRGQLARLERRRHRRHTQPGGRRVHRRLVRKYGTRQCDFRQQRFRSCDHPLRHRLR